MIRLFVALELPADLRRRMGQISTGVRDSRWVDEENLHLTLRFIGEVEDCRVEELVSALEVVESPAFPLTLSGAGHFESRKRVRMLWIGTEKSAELVALVARIEHALVRAGLPPEGRKFNPHITIARLKGAPPGDIAQWLSANTLFKAFPFQVTRFALYASYLGRAGPIYEMVAAFSLHPAPSSSDQVR